MGPKTLLAHNWLLDNAELAASSEGPTTPVSNLQRQDPRKPWLATDVAGVTVTVRLPEVDDLLWDLVAPLYTNASADATWRVVAAASDDGLDTPTYDSGVMSCWPCPGMDAPGNPEFKHAFSWISTTNPAGHQVGAPRSESFIRIYWDDPKPFVSAGDPVVQWGRLFVSLAWRPYYGRERGAALSPSAERTRSVRTLGGGNVRSRGPKPRKYSFSLGSITDAEAKTRAYEIARIVGAGGQLLVIDDPSDAAHLHQRFIVGSIDPVSQRHDGFDSSSTSYTIEEDL